MTTIKDQSKAVMNLAVKMARDQVRFANQMLRDTLKIQKALARKTANTTSRPKGRPETVMKQGPQIAGKRLPVKRSLFGARYARNLSKKG